MTRPLSPPEMYPASVAGVTTRMIRLATGVTVRVAEAGPRTGELVVCLHGWGASLFSFRSALELLPPAGFRVVAPDLRGFGLSDRPKSPHAYSLRAFHDDAIALLDALDARRAAFIGHSMGGQVALDLALTSPERVAALALINPTGLAPLHYIGLLRTAPRFVVDAIGRHLMPRSLVIWILRHLAYGDPARVTERVVDEYWAPTQLPGFVLAARATLSDMSWAPFPAAALRSLTVASVVISGRSDKLVRAGNPAALTPSIRAHVLAGGHCVHEEQPEESMRIIAQSLASSATTS